MFLKENWGCKYSKEEFWQIIEPAFNEAMKPHIISKAFENVGAYPINKAAIDLSQLRTSAINQAHEPDETSDDAELPTAAVSIAPDNFAGTLSLCFLLICKTKT